MSNLSTVGGADMSSLIGTLELMDDLAILDDGSLEASGTNAVLGPPTTPSTGCYTIRCIGDDALVRAADTTIAPPMTAPRPMGFC
jgi:hypothetical protein